MSFVIKAFRVLCITFGLFLSVTIHASRVAAEEPFLKFSVEVEEINSELLYLSKVYVEENGRKYLIEPNNDRWYRIDHYSKKIFQIVDLDGDGTDEAIIETFGSGASCCGPNFLIIKRIEEGFYIVIESDKLIMVDLSVQSEGDIKVLVAKDIGDGHGNTSFEEVITTMKLVNGQLKTISQNHNSAIIPSEIEIYSKDLEKLGNQTLTFDLDMDTKPDELHCTYHSRYGDIGCTVVFSKLGEGTVRAGCDRFGILKSTTNGIHNLICDHSDILTWDPKIKEYTMSEQ